MTPGIEYIVFLTSGCLCIFASAHAEHERASRAMLAFGVIFLVVAFFVFYPALSV